MNKQKKLSRADMAADVALTKMAMSRGDIWECHVSFNVYVRICVSAHV